ncbi:MAG: aminopeptidase P family N-terminal domain-containing protein, partial [Muribaculaceae bacterium]|nr:aminopeptidase P family N-terminal domain-containing protein [Muribaculaceae bacterium]
LPSTPSLKAFLCSTLSAGQLVGINGMMFSTVSAGALRAALEIHSIKLTADFDPIDTIWTDRPTLPDAKIFVHDVKYAGVDARTKIADIIAALPAQQASSQFVSALDEIAWTLNIRSNDVTYNPVATSFLYIAPADGSVLFVDSAKLTDEVTAYLSEQGVSVKPYTEVMQYIKSLPEDARVLIEPDRTAEAIDLALGQRSVHGASPIAEMKACKTPVQIAGIKNAMRRDGVALVHSFMEIEERVAHDDGITELDVADILRRNRAAQDLFFDESFGTIAGYEGHGAIVHYEADGESASTLHPTGLLLIDSGAQYLDGTTDITRTIALGTPTAQERRDFTLVMKGHIAMAKMIFPEGTNCAQIDVIARQYLWKNGLSYLHGTGHGVGNFL